MYFFYFQEKVWCASWSRWRKKRTTKRSNKQRQKCFHLPRSTNQNEVRSHFFNEDDMTRIECLVVTIQLWLGYLFVLFESLKPSVIFKEAVNAFRATGFFCSCFLPVVSLAYNSYCLFCLKETDIRHVSGCYPPARRRRRHPRWATRLRPHRRLSTTTTKSPGSRAWQRLRDTLPQFI